MVVTYYIGDGIKLKLPPEKAQHTEDRWYVCKKTDRKFPEIESFYLWRDGTWNRQAHKECYEGWFDSREEAIEALKVALNEKEIVNISLIIERE